MAPQGTTRVDAGAGLDSNARVSGVPGERAQASAPPRACGPCSLCCTLLRVDELAKLAGTPCVHQRPGHPEGGCAIHPMRPAVCRRYRCLWLRGSLEAGDRPDLLGAVLDLASRGGFPELVVHEAEPGSAQRSPRLREIVERYRSAMPVRILDAESVLDPDRGFRILLPGGEELRVAGEQVETWRAGERVGERRLAWLERLARQIAIAARRVHLRPHRRGPRSAAASRREG
jgi:hypothetical protein